METSLIRTKLNNFPIITDEHGFKYFGGSQNWFADDFLQKKGCGIVSATNIAASLALSEDRRYSALYPRDNLDKEMFVNAMTDMAGYIKPGIVFGILPGNYIKGFLAYAESTGVGLVSHEFRFGDGIDAMVSFIEFALRNEKPLAMLIGINSRLRKVPVNIGRANENNFNTHWVTVTGLLKNNQTGRDVVTVSSWGYSAEIELDTYYKTFIKKLVYFD